MYEYFIYLGRWILSYFVLLVPLWLLMKWNCCNNKYQEYIHLFILQVVGSIIFYPIDKMIFK